MTSTTIYQKLLEVQKEVEPIKKTEDNPFFKSKYFDVNSILAALKPILSAHGLVLLQAINIDALGKNVLTTTVIDSFDGEKINSTIYLPDVSDPQKFGSAVTYYRRYALQSLFALEAEDDDGNVAVAESRPIFKSTTPIQPAANASGGITLYKTPAVKPAPPWKKKPQPEAGETLIPLND